MVGIGRCPGRLRAARLSVGRFYSLSGTLGLDQGSLAIGEENSHLLRAAVRLDDSLAEVRMRDTVARGVLLTPVVGPNRA